MVHLIGMPPGRRIGAYRCDGALVGPLRLQEGAEREVWVSAQAAASSALTHIKSRVDGWSVLCCVVNAHVLSGSVISIRNVQVQAKFVDEVDGFRDLIT